MLCINSLHIEMVDW